MDDNTLALIEARCLDHKFDVRALINEVRTLKADNARLRAAEGGRDVSDKAIDVLQADIEDEIDYAAIDYIFGTYGRPAALARRAFNDGAKFGIELAARIIEYGK